MLESLLDGDECLILELSMKLISFAVCRTYMMTVLKS